MTLSPSLGLGAQQARGRSLLIPPGGSDFATELPRDDAMIEADRVALQMTPAQMDDLFRLAATP